MAEASEPRGACYDAIVIGAGIQGSFAAYHLAERGRDTLLLEQFLLPHARGSSHGQSRIIRSAYLQQHYARMMPESFRLWQRLEDRAGTRLYRRTGLLVLGAPGEPPPLPRPRARRRRGGAVGRRGRRAPRGPGAAGRAGAVPPQRRHLARRREGAGHRAGRPARREHLGRRVPGPAARRRGRRLEQPAAGTARPPAAAAAPARPRLLLEGESARELQRRAALPLLHGRGAAPGPPRRLRAALLRVPGAGQGVLPPRQPHRPRPAGPPGPGRRPPRRGPAAPLRGLLPAGAGARAGPAGALPLHEHPGRRLHPGPAPQAQQHHHRGRLLGPRVQAGAGGGEAAVRAQPGRGAVLQHGALQHRPLPRRAPGRAVGRQPQPCPCRAGLAAACPEWGIPASLHLCTPHPSIPASRHPCMPASLHPTSQQLHILASQHPHIPALCIPTSQHPCTSHPSIPTSQLPSIPASHIPASQHPHSLASQHSLTLHPGIPTSPHPCTPASPRRSTSASRHPGPPAPLQPCTRASPCRCIPASLVLRGAGAGSAEHPLPQNELRSFVSGTKMELVQRRETHSLRSQLKCFNVKCAILLSLDRSHLMKAH